MKNAIKILNCFTDEKEEIGINEFALILDINNSTIHHIVKTLSNDGILVKTKERKYRIGTRVLGWSRIVLEQYKAIYNAAPYLDELVYKTNSIAQLAVRENHHVSTLLRIKPDRTNRVENVIGEKSPLYCTGLGKVLLSTNYANEDFQRFKFIKYTNTTICSLDELDKEIVQVKIQGYAINNEEYRKDVFCVAVPIKNRSGINIAAISLSNSLEMIKGNQDKMITLLLTTAKKISASLFPK